MNKIIDETGNKYGRLTVLSFTKTDSNGVACWLCRCDCGNETTVRGTNLRQKNTVSCGCYQREHKWGLRDGNSILQLAATKVWHTYKYHAERRNYIWKLTKKQVEEIIIQVCHYCGVENSNVFKGRGAGYKDFHYNGIDRVNNNLGYTIDNIVPCCYTCNMTKRTSSKEEFLTWVKRVYDYNFKEE